jgi:tetratricopeptide (TPR) repeat protein
VALKVLPWAAAMDPRQLQRFKNEALAAASLKHDHIVAVYAVGCERGVHYYAMEFIDGPTLAQLIHRQRQAGGSPATGGATPDGPPGDAAPTQPVAAVPTERAGPRGRAFYRHAAELIAQAADGLEHAHQLGIVHRDVKPANLLLDAAGKVYVSDFGLARFGADAGLTLTGDLLGTLRYMSPEQALAKHGLVDHRTDVYALGATLYELLTLRPAVGGEDKQEVLRRIAFEEPVAPRKLDQAIPAELETVTLKALAKTPAERYATAGELADDLRRWLTDQAITAKPPTLVQRAGRWGRRHRPVVWSALAAGLAVAAVAAGGVGWVARDRAVRQRETERGVTAAAAQAETLLAVTDTLTDDPARWLATAELAAAAVQRAADLLAAGGGSDDLVVRVGHLRDAVGGHLADSRLLVEFARIQLEQAAVKDGHFHTAIAAPRYAAVLRDYGVDPAAPATAAARVRDSRLRQALLAALEGWRRATPSAAERRRVEAVLDAAEPAPDTFRVRWRQAVRGRDGAALAKLAAEPGAQSLAPAAVQILAQDLANLREWAAAERLLRPRQERDPGNFWLTHDLGMVLLDQKPPHAEGAVRYLTAALALRSDSPGVHLNLGNALGEAGDEAGAVREYREALRLDPNYAMAHCNLGNVATKQGDDAGAVREYREAIRLDPGSAHAHAGLGGMLRHIGDLAGAVRESREAVRLDPYYAFGHYKLGDALRDSGDIDGAIRECQTALRLDPDLALAHNTLGVAFQQKKDFARAVRELREAVRLDPDLVAARGNLGDALRESGDIDGAIRECQTALRLDANCAPAHVSLGIALHAKGDAVGAVRELREAVRLAPNDALAHNNLGGVLYSTGKPAEAEVEYRRAIALKPNYALAHYSLGFALAEQGRLPEAEAEYRQAVALQPDNAHVRTNLGSVLAEQGRLPEAEAEHRRAIALKPDDAIAHYNLGNVLGRQKKFVEAEAEYRRAIALRPDYAEAYCNLSLALQTQGRFTDSLASIRRGHELGTRNPKWAIPSADWVREAERLVELDARLAEVLPGRSRPADAAEGVALAQFCQQCKELYAASARFYGEAFAGRPDLSVGEVRYNAACAAALAGCGQGKDAAGLGDPERARLRGQALAWLRAELDDQRQRLDNEPAKARPTVLQQMQHWPRDADLAGVRGAEALARLPEAERADWQKLWADVETLRRRAAESK